MLRKVSSVAACWLVITSTVLFATAGIAGACSCEAVSAETFEWADGGLYGTVLDAEDFAYTDSSGDNRERVILLFDVEIDLLDNLPDQVLVESERDDGGNCGISVSVGDQIGMAVAEDEQGVVRGDGCREFGREFAETFEPSLEVTKQVGSGLTAEQRMASPLPDPVPPQPGEEAPPALAVPAPMAVEDFAEAPPGVPLPVPPIVEPAERPVGDSGNSSRAFLWIGIGVAAVLGLTGAVVVSAKD